MQDLPLGERLTRIEDELALVDSSLDARTRLIWQELDGIKRMVAELRDRYAHPHARARDKRCLQRKHHSDKSGTHAREG